MQKQKKHNREETEQPVHVQIDTPIQLRKTILKSAIDTTKLMQTTHEMEALRKEELNRLYQLKKIFDEIKRLDKELIKALPKLPEEHMKKIKIEEPEEEITETLEHNDELTSLRQELEHIERKLKEYK